MKIDAISLIDGMSGKLNKREKVVFSKRYGNIHAWEVEHSKKDPTANQLAAQERFTAAAKKAATDMKDPEKKAEWQAVADASNGKHKTARGAAFASYYAENSNLE